MEKLVSFNSLDELFRSLSNLPNKVSLPVLGARGQAKGSQELYKVLTSLTQKSTYPKSFLIVGYEVSTRGSISPFADELTSSNFSTYFPSGVCLLSDPLLKEVA